MVQPLCKTVWQFLKTLNIELTYDPIIPLLVIYPKEIYIYMYISIYIHTFTHTHTLNLYLNVYSSITYYNQKVETIKISVN